MHRLNVCIAQEGREKGRLKHLCGDGLILNRVGGYPGGGGLAIIYRYHSFFFCLLFVVLWCYMIGSVKVLSLLYAHTETTGICVVADTGTLNLWLTMPAHGLSVRPSIYSIYSELLAQTSLSKQLSCRAA